MIVDERFITYINSLDSGNSPFLEELEREARDSFVPVIRREMQSFLKVFLAMKRPERILEVGTAVGFSAILMCENLPAASRITTIENYEKRIPTARENFRRSGYEDRITLLEGDAARVLKTLPGPYDFIFMDAAKGQYIRFLPEVLRLMGPGSVLISDNVLQDGEIIESRFAVERRNRTIHKRMREYLYEIKHHPRLVTSVLPLGDGITVSVYRE
ncbi:MAG TPA: O-methyltransferase [Lachnospiraceae bacterium]|nr:O-methyltransferase [Lachnospiraceae bacterium]